MLVDDPPHGQLARVVEAERTLEHQEAQTLEASVRTASSRPTVPAIHTVDPFGSIHARTHLFDKVVNGKQGFASLTLAWMLFGLPLVLFAEGNLRTYTCEARLIYWPTPSARAALTNERPTSTQITFQLLDRPCP